MLDSVMIMDESRVLLNESIVRICEKLCFKESDDRSLMDKAMIMVLPVAMFVASGFEHSIANMFMIPMGIVIRNFASPEFWTAIGSTPESFSHLTVMNFITDNLIPVTIGNIIGGGLLVGLTYWVIYLRGNDHH